MCKGQPFVMKWICFVISLAHSLRPIPPVMILCYAYTNTKIIIPLKNISNFSKKPKNNICTMNSLRWYHGVGGIIAFYVPAIFDVRERIPLFGLSEGRKISRSYNFLNSTFACQWEKYFPHDVNYETEWKYLMLNFEGKILFRDLNGINISSLFQHLHPFIFNFCWSFKFNKA